MSNFDERALNWDQDEERVGRAMKVAECMQKQMPLNMNMRAMEYGCGTGLLSFNLYPYLKKILMADSSQGMLRVLKEKIQQKGFENMTTIKLDLNQEEPPGEKFDLIYSMMTMHHILDLDPVFKEFYRMLEPGGYLCIADIVEEDGSFHGEGFTGHNGFNREELMEKLKSLGFSYVDYQVCFEIIRKTMGKSQDKFPVFSLVVQK